ncbi:hypothetical protein FSP39_000277 [Pinctada imbricata]|uniref:Uncharacterized protein n=1 Tax=Pinctada imbricata TaxID=66713 RepID=A0AA88Y1P7_PINIB|nr:hypothetical protein FSP39_000277 [Pinctada imbricata]
MYYRNKNVENKLRMNEASKSYKKTMNKYIRQHKKNMEDILRNLRSKFPKENWKILNGFRKKGDIKADLNELFDYFKTVNETSESGNEGIVTENDAQESLNEILNDDISIEEIKTGIAKLKTGKSAGIDGVINEFIINTNDTLLPIIHKMFCLILDSGCLPDDG